MVLRSTRQSSRALSRRDNASTTEGGRHSCPLLPILINILHTPFFDLAQGRRTAGPALPRRSLCLRNAASEYACKGKVIIQKKDQFFQIFPSIFHECIAAASSDGGRRFSGGQLSCHGQMNGPLFLNKAVKKRGPSCRRTCRRTVDGPPVPGRAGGMPPLKRPDRDKAPAFSAGASCYPQRRMAMWARSALSFWKNSSRNSTRLVLLWSIVRLICTRTWNSRSRLTSLSQPQTAEKRYRLYR